MIKYLFNKWYRQELIKAHRKIDQVYVPICERMMQQSDKLEKLEFKLDEKIKDIEQRVDRIINLVSDNRIIKPRRTVNDR